MDKWIDRFFCGLLALGAAGHLFGTLQLSGVGTSLFVWSLSGVLAAGLLSWLNFLRVARPRDEALAWVTLAGNLGWLLIVLLFGHSLGNYLDFRVLFHGIATAGLVFFSYRTLFISRS